jgi:hypothetical protein
LPPRLNALTDEVSTCSMSDIFSRRREWLNHAQARAVAQSAALAVYVMRH